MSETTLSIVLPVRNGEDRIVERVRQVFAELRKVTNRSTEIVVVDDGSQDRTSEVLESLHQEIPKLRVVRHSRPRGMEAAGQTGLERSSGDLVFIQETDSSIRFDDLQRLLKMSEDPSVVAARAESQPQPLASALVRRLRAWGAAADDSLEDQTIKTEPACLQMVRRPQLQRLAGRSGDKVSLENQTVRTASLDFAVR